MFHKWIFTLILLSSCQVFAADKVLVLGAEDDAAPWSYSDGSGYVNDLVRQAFLAVGWQVRYEVMPYARCKQLAIKGSLAGCFSASRTPGLESTLLYPEQPVFVAENLLIADKNSPLSGCDPAGWGKRLHVALVNAYEYIPAVDTLLRAGHLQADYSNSEKFSLRKLATHRVDAALITTDQVKHIEFVATQAEVKPDFKVLCDFGGYPAYVAFSRNHPNGSEARDAFNRGMALLKKGQAIQHLQSEWQKRSIKKAIAKG